MELMYEIELNEEGQMSRVVWYGVQAGTVSVSWTVGLLIDGCLTHSTFCVTYFRFGFSETTF